MFERWRRKRRNREVVDRIYDALVARARQPRLYLEGGLPDTVMGRYDALAVEVFLFLHRCRGDEALGALAQDLVDRFMLDMDHSLREIGIGYQGVPKRMRRLAGRFYARVASFEEPLSERDEDALAQAIETRLFADVEAPPGATRFLARRMIEADEAYRRVPVPSILSGQLDDRAEAGHGA